MNQKGRQNATSSVEKDFYKLLNNSKFGIDCRNNIDFQKFPILKNLQQFSMMIHL